jgi:hypothetical protein
MQVSRQLLPLLFIGTFFLASVVMADSSLQSGGKFKIEGSWELEIIPAPGSGLPPSFKALATFSDGGGVVETILLPPVVPAHGAWEKTGSRDYIFSVVHHLLDTSGNFIGTVRAKSLVSFTSRDEFTATFDGALFDMSGNLIAPVSGSETGKRITAQ